MSQIHILDKYNFEVKEVLSNKQSKKVILEDTHKRNIENHTETYDFTVDYKASEFIENRDRIIIPDEQRGLYREFIVNKVETDTYYGETEVFSEASYLEDLQKAKAIAPQTLAENTPKTAMEFALRGTGWQVGEVEYAGFRTMSWTSYNTPYEVLKIIANRFSLQLDFTIETRGNKVTKRLVHLRNRKALFKGKEIRRGKDLAELKRSTISTDVVTALIALAPEPEDGKERLMVEVKDDEAQAKWGKSYNYLWGIYEPESDNSEMTKARLTTLATTELNKHNKPKVDYTIDAVSVEEQFPHEKVRIGDNVRIKDDLTEPYFYVDATVKEVTRSIFNKNSKTYVLGEIVEHKREDLRKHFNAMIAMLSKRLSETSSNIDNIVTIIDTAVERRIFRQPTPPENPTNGQLWLDTSNTNNAILKEYFNGQWVVRIDNPTEDDIEAISRSTAMYESILSSLRNFEVLHMQLLTDANLITTNKYLNQKNIDNINEKLQLVINTYNQLKAEVNKYSDCKKVTLEQANFIHQLMLDYTNAIQALKVAIGTAQKYAMEHLAILQAQYTDEKFTEAIEVTAERLGFIVEDDVIKLSPDSPVSDVIEALRQDTEDQFKSVVKQVDYDADKEGIVDRLNAADSERTQLSNEIKDRVTLTDYSKDKTEQTGRISTLETSVTQNGQAITLKANQDDLDSVERTLSTKQAQLEVKADGIESNVKGLNDDLAQAKTSINQSIDGITQQVSANKKGITDANSMIEQRASEIELGVSKKIDSPSRNLIPFSTLPEENDKWSGFNSSTSITKSYDYMWVYDYTGQSNNSMAVQSSVLPMEIYQGQKYTLSFKIARLSNVHEDMRYCYLLNENGSNYFIPTSIIKKESLGKDYRGLDLYYYTVTFEPDFSGKARVLIGTRTITTANSIFYLKEPQLEMGEVATPYKPAPTDLLEAKAQFKITTDNISSEVGKKVGNNEIISKINQSAEKVSINADKINLTAGSNLKLAVDNALRGGSAGVNLIGNTDFWINYDDFENTHIVSNTDETLKQSVILNTGFGKGWVRFKRVDGALSYMWTRRSSRNYFSITKGRTYTFSVLAATNWDNELNYVHIRGEDTTQVTQTLHGTSSDVTRARERIGTVNGRGVYKHTYTFKADFTTSRGLMIFGMNNTAETTAGFYLSEWKLEEGDVATPYQERLTGNNIISQINADETSMVISSSKVSITADDINIDGKTIQIGSNPAITSLKSDVNDAQSTASTAKTQADAARNGNNVVNSINNSGTSVSISGEKISLTGTAEFNSAFGSDRGITAISGGRIETDSMRAKKIEILRSDGAVYMNNGIPNMSMDLQRNQLHHPTAVSFDGQNYVYNANFMTGYEMYSCEAIYTTHHSRYVTINFGVNLFAGANSIQALVELAEFGGGSKVIAGQYLVRQSSSTDYYALTLDLGRPDYSSKQFYVRAGMQSAASANRLRLRVNRVYMWG